MLLRTEVIGLNAWLAAVGVPNVQPSCDCGWRAQTVRHILLHCPTYGQQRLDLLRQVESEDLHKILSRAKSVQAIACWCNRTTATPALALPRAAADCPSSELSQRRDA